MTPIVKRGADIRCPTPFFLKNIFKGMHTAQMAVHKLIMKEQAMVGLAGASILYNTSNVLYRYPEDRYVAASLQLFASVALLFWYVLRIFISRR